MRMHHPHDRAREMPPSQKGSTGSSARVQAMTPLPCLEIFNWPGSCARNICASRLRCRKSGRANCQGIDPYTAINRLLRHFTFTIRLRTDSRTSLGAAPCMAASVLAAGPNARCRSVHLTLDRGILEHFTSSGAVSSAAASVLTTGPNLLTSQPPLPPPLPCRC